MNKILETFHLDSNCSFSKCAAENHIYFHHKISSEAAWILLASPQSEVNSDQISRISKFLEKEEIHDCIFVLDFTYDNVGKVEILPLVEEMGWSDSKYVSGPVVLVNRKYKDNFDSIDYVADENIFWSSVVKSCFRSGSSVLPFPSNLVVTRLHYKKVNSEFDYHDLHRKVLSEYEAKTFTPWLYQELIMALSSAVNLDTTKSKLLFKLEKVSTRIVFPPGTMRRKVILKILKAMNYLN